LEGITIRDLIKKFRLEGITIGNLQKEFRLEDIRRLKKII